mmetsp:Transcript_56860/g.151775  ORF Transcript_56860/g.151775 Transcript_56860/m.151775 type:complete len:542 (+) Transcript_56860:313-1938(+)
MLLFNLVLPPVLTYWPFDEVVKWYSLTQVDVRNSLLTQAEFNELHEGPTFDLAESLAQTVKNLVSAILFAPILPLAIPLGAVTLRVQYSVVSRLLLVKARRPMWNTGDVVFSAVGCTELLLLAVPFLTLGLMSTIVSPETLHHPVVHISFLCAIAASALTALRVKKATAGLVLTATQASNRFRNDPRCARTLQCCSSHPIPTQEEEDQGDIVFSMNPRYPGVSQFDSPGGKVPHEHLESDTEEHSDHAPLLGQCCTDAHAQPLQLCGATVASVPSELVADLSHLKYWEVEPRFVYKYYTLNPMYRGLALEEEEEGCDDVSPRARELKRLCKVGQVDVSGHIAGLVEALDEQAGSTGGTASKVVLEAHSKPLPGSVQAYRRSLNGGKEARTSVNKKAHFASMIRSALSHDRTRKMVAQTQNRDPHAGVEGSFRRTLTSSGFGNLGVGSSPAGDIDGTDLHGLLHRKGFGSLAAGDLSRRSHLGSGGTPRSRTTGDPRPRAQSESTQLLTDLSRSRNAQRVPRTDVTTNLFGERIVDDDVVDR